MSQTVIDTGGPLAEPVRVYLDALESFVGAFDEDQEDEKTRQLFMALAGLVCVRILTSPGLSQEAFDAWDQVAGRWLNASYEMSAAINWNTAEGPVELYERVDGDRILSSVAKRFAALEKKRPELPLTSTLNSATIGLAVAAAAVCKAPTLASEWFGVTFAAKTTASPRSRGPDVVAPSEDLITALRVRTPLVATIMKSAGAEQSEIEQLAAEYLARGAAAGFGRGPHHSDAAIWQRVWDEILLPAGGAQQATMSEFLLDSFLDQFRGVWHRDVSTSTSAEWVQDARPTTSRRKRRGSLSGRVA